MTYKEIVDNIKDIVDAHHILADFGYGQISDIKTGGDDQEANYPYAFLNPQTHTRSERAINYRFNLIVMDMYLGDDFLSAQSQCQQYIDDILAEMKYGTQTYDIAINATLTPFKERFQDVVGGMTATIDIEVPQKLNLCVAPFNNDVLINKVLVNIAECPAFDTSFRAAAAAPYPGYPESKQNNEFYAKFDTPGAFTDCNQGFTPLAINDVTSTTEPYYKVSDREWTIPLGVTGEFKFEFDLQLTNVQGIDLSSDRLRLRVIKDDDTVTYSDLPELPINGDIVNYRETFTINATSKVNSVRVLFRYTDEGTPAPIGPLVGYTGTAKIYQVL